MSAAEDFLKRHRGVVRRSVSSLMILRISFTLYFLLFVVRLPSLTSFVDLFSGAYCIKINDHRRGQIT